MDRARAFHELIDRPEGEWDPFELALEVCRQRRGRDALGECRDQVGAWGRRVAETVDGDDLYSLLEAVNRVLYQEEGFAGNRDNFYDPDNSYLTDVVEKRTGIPITLCLLFREVALGVGLRLQCVGMPGHFMLKCRTPARELFVDAFTMGQLMLEDECRERLAATYSGLEFQPEFLRAVNAREVILRLLLNLKQIYRRAGEHELLVGVLDRRIPLVDDPLPEILERGLTLAAMEDYRSALDDLTAFVESTPDDELRKVVGQRLEEVRRLAVGH